MNELVEEEDFISRGFVVPCFGFDCHRQQKRHAVTPPPAAVRRRMERKRQKLVGRDKGSLTETANRENRNHRITESQNSRGWKGPLWVI